MFIKVFAFTLSCSMSPSVMAFPGIWGDWGGGKGEERAGEKAEGSKGGRELNEHGRLS